MARINEVTKSIMDMVFETLGVDREVTHQWVANLSLKDLEKFIQIGEVKLNPAMLGPMAAVFAKVQVTVEAGYASGTNHVVLRFEYRWTHCSGGTNGHTVQLSRAIC